MHATIGAVAVLQHWQKWQKKKKKGKPSMEIAASPCRHFVPVALADNLLRPPKRTQSSCPVDCRRWSTEFLSTASF